MKIMWFLILALVCFLNGYCESEEVIFHCYYTTDLLYVGLQNEYSSTIKFKGTWGLFIAQDS